MQFFLATGREQVGCFDLEPTRAIRNHLICRRGGTVNICVYTTISDVDAVGHKDNITSDPDSLCLGPQESPEELDGAISSEAGKFLNFKGERRYHHHWEPLSPMFLEIGFFRSQSIKPVSGTN
jgi:hypothetical protein